MLNMHTTIDEIQENSWRTGSLLRNIYVGSRKMQEHENHTDDADETDR